MHASGALPSHIYLSCFVTQRQRKFGWFQVVRMCAYAGVYLRHLIKMRFQWNGDFFFIFESIRILKGSGWCLPEDCIEICSLFLIMFTHCSIWDGRLRVINAITQEKFQKSKQSDWKVISLSIWHFELSYGVIRLSHYKKSWKWTRTFGYVGTRVLKSKSVFSSFAMFCDNDIEDLFQKRWTILIKIEWRNHFSFYKGTFMGKFKWPFLGSFVSYFFFLLISHFVFDVGIFLRPSLASFISFQKFGNCWA